MKETKKPAIEEYIAEAKTKMPPEEPKQNPVLPRVDVPLPECTRGKAQTYDNARSVAFPGGEGVSGADG